MAAPGGRPAYADPFSSGIDELGPYAEASKIKGLGMLVEDALGNSAAVQHLAMTLLHKLQLAPPPHKLPILYLMDYIVKHRSLAGEFQYALGPYIAAAFVEAFMVVSGSSTGQGEQATLGSKEARSKERRERREEERGYGMLCCLDTS